MPVWLETHKNVTMWELAYRVKKQKKMLVTIGWVEWRPAIADTPESGSVTIRMAVAEGGRSREGGLEPVKNNHDSAPLR